MTRNFFSRFKHFLTHPGKQTGFNLGSKENKRRISSREFRDVMHFGDEVLLDVVGNFTGHGDIGEKFFEESGDIKNAIDEIGDVFDIYGNLVTPKHRPIPPRQPTIPKEGGEDGNKTQNDTHKEFIISTQHSDRHNIKILNDELQALESIEEKEQDLLGRMATKLDPPVNLSDFIKDLLEFASKESKEEYLEENFFTLQSLPPNEIQQILSVIG
jgi:hypothetical protein